MTRARLGQGRPNPFIPSGYCMKGQSGIALVVTGPSGAGKSSVIDALLERDRGLSFSISATTRAIRPGETHGVDYTFVSEAEFDAMVGRGEFLEWTTYQGQKYGTPRSEVEGRLAAGETVVLNVEVEGALSIRDARLPYPVVLVFLVPPTPDELARRIRGRGTETDASLARRLAIAEEEIRHIPDFHYLVVNDVLEVATAQVHAILEAERCRIVPCSA